MTTIPEPAEHVITSASGAYTRLAWLVPGPAEVEHPLYLFLDGDMYLREAEALTTMARLMEGGAIPRGTCLYLAGGTQLERAADFTCREEYARFVAEEVCAWAREHAPGVAEGGAIVCGASLSGLAAAHMACLHPGRFAGALCQSGSFWWLKGREVSLPARVEGRFWLSVGNRETATDLTHQPSGLYQEISQIEGVQAAAARLEALGATVNYHVFPGAHLPRYWKEDLIPGLRWLCGRAA